MFKKEKTPEGLLISLQPFGQTSSNSECRIVAEAKDQGKQYARRIFVRGLDGLHGMTIGDSIVLVTAIRAIIDEIKKVTKRPKNVVHHSTKRQSVSSDRVRRQGKGERRGQGKQRTRRAR